MNLSNRMLAVGGFAIAASLAPLPSAAAETQSIDRGTQQRLDQASAEFSQWRARGWRGNRGAAVAAGVAAGVIGGAAIAASRPAYGYGYPGGYYTEPGYYGYDYAPSYYEPGYAYEYAPAPRYSYVPRTYSRGYPQGSPSSRMFEGAPDPARGGGR